MWLNPPIYKQVSRNKIFQRNFSNRVIGITNSVQLYFQNSIDASTTLFQNLIRKGLTSLLKQVLSEPEFYEDLVYKFRKKCWLDLFV